MYIVRWDDFEGERHEMQFERKADAELEAHALETMENVLYVEVVKISKKNPRPC